MTDQATPANLTRKEARAVREWAERAWNTKVQDATVAHAARVLLAVLPPRPTLADMTDEERAACKWMQCEVNGEIRVITLIRESNDHAVTLAPSGFTFHCPPEKVTPRPDLPRMEWPGTGQDGEEATKVDYVSVAGGRTAYGPWTVARLRKKADPAPALPDGWRLADHPEHGRVIVTTPARDGRAYYVLPAADHFGFDWHFCDPSALTYIDQEADQ